MTSRKNWPLPPFLPWAEDSIAIIGGFEPAPCAALFDPAASLRELGYAEGCNLRALSKPLPVVSDRRAANFLPAPCAGFSMAAVMAGEDNLESAQASSRATLPARDREGSGASTLSGSAEKPQPMGKAAGASHAPRKPGQPNANNKQTTRQ